MPHKTSKWFRLSEAADYLGVHFTTLRRWSDDGNIPVYKTPGGRRRYLRSDLDSYLRGTQSNKISALEIFTNPGPRTEVMQNIRHTGIREQSWIREIDPDHRGMMGNLGKSMVGVFMQYMGRPDKGDQFLEEGKKLAAEYGQVCCETGLNIDQTIQAFVMIRHAIVDTLCEAGMVIEDSGRETWNLYQRVNRFFDLILLILVKSFQDTHLSNSQKKSK
jgi:excisionase family DNA binding protein